MIRFASVMTKIEGREGDNLLRTYGFGGFPSLAILDAEGEAIIKQFGRVLPSMQTAVTKAATFTKFKSKVDAGEDYDETKWFFMRLDLGQLNIAEAKEACAELKLEGAAAKKADQAILAMEVGEVGSPGFSGDRPEAIYKFFKAGRTLAKDASMESYYHRMLVQAAQKHDDGVAFKFSYKQERLRLIKNIETMKGRLAQAKKDQKKYEDASNARMVRRVQGFIDQGPRQIERIEQSITKLDAFNDKLKN